MRNRRITTKDFAYSEIKQRIIEGEYEPNQPLVEEELASQLGISRTPLREALHRLEIEELIQRQSNGRLKVAPISVKEVKEIFRLRSLIEGLVANEATQRATEEDIRKLRDLTRLMVEASEEDRREDVVFYGSQFHAYLYEISQYRTAVKILLQLNDHIYRYRRLGPLRNEGRSKKAAEEHVKIFEAIASGDHIGAEQAMRNHILNSLDSAVITIESYLNELTYEE